MSLFGDDHYEMQAHPLLDEQTTESILAGRSPSGRPELDEVASFVNEVRSVASAHPPVVGTQLAAVLAGGLTTEKGDLPATAASNVTGPAPQAAGLPKRRNPMLETILAKAALAKAAAVLGGLSLATTAAAAVGVLPGAAQNGVAAVVEALSPFDLPDSDDKRRDAEHRNDDVAEDTPEVPAPQADPNAQDNFGATVSGRAPEEPKQDGRAFGESVSNSAPKAPAATDAQTRRPASAQQPSSTPTASNNPGTSYRQSVPAQPPTSTPTADSNPGSGYRR